MSEKDYQVYHTLFRLANNTRRHIKSHIQVTAKYFKVIGEVTQHDEFLYVFHTSNPDFIECCQKVLNLEWINTSGPYDRKMKSEFKIRMSIHSKQFKGQLSSKRSSSGEGTSSSTSDPIGGHSNLIISEQKKSQQRNKLNPAASEKFVNTELAEFMGDLTSKKYKSDLKGWLQSIEMSDLYDNFVKNGYARLRVLAKIGLCKY